MKICQSQRPELIEGQNGVKVACFLYDEKTKSESPELFEKLTKAQKERFDL
jgi:hypothetical protein